MQVLRSISALANLSQQTGNVAARYWSVCIRILFPRF